MSRDVCKLTATSSVVCRRYRLPSGLVRGQESTVCDVQGMVKKGAAIISLAGFHQLQGILD